MVPMLTLMVAKQADGSMMVARKTDGSYNYNHLAW